MIYLIMLICGAPILYLVRFSVFDVPTTMLEIFIYFSVILTLIIKVYKNEKFIFPKKEHLLPIFLFIVSGLISTIMAPDKMQALGLFKAYIIDPILFFFVLYLNVRNEKQLNYIFVSLMISAMIVSIHAIYQKIFGINLSDGRVVGIFGYSPNYLALYLSPLAVLTFGYAFSFLKVNRLSFNFLILIFFLIACAVIFSGSRAGIGALAVGLGVYLIIKYFQAIKSNKIILALLMPALVAGIYFSWQAMKPDWDANPASLRAATSNNIRFEIWKTTLADILPKNGNWIWGVGLGNYQDYFTELTKNRVNYPEWISPWALTPHNLFLNIWINLGLLGLASFIWILILFSKSIGFQTRYSAVLISVMAVMISQGLFDSTYWKNDLGLVFWIFIGLGLIISDKRFNGNEET